MDAFVRAVAALSRACGVVSAALIAVSVLVVCQMVFLRYALSAPTIWQTEFVTYALIAATYVGSPYVLLHGGHVNIDLLPQYLGERGRLVLALLASGISLTFCLVIAFTGYALWFEAWDREWYSDSIWEVRLWIPYLAMPVGIGLLCLQYTADILCLLNGRPLPYQAQTGSSR